MSRSEASAAKLRRSARTYLRLVDDLPSPEPRTPEGRETSDYLRQLYAEFGDKAVREEIERQRRAR